MIKIKKIWVRKSQVGHRLDINLKFMINKMNLIYLKTSLKMLNYLRNRLIEILKNINFFIIQIHPNKAFNKDITEIKVEI